MAVTVDNLLDQLSEDEERKPQLQIYFDTAKTWVKNAVTSENDEDSFFSTSQAAPLVDIAILSYSMDLWTYRSVTMPASTAVWQMIGQLRGLYSTWKEEQDGKAIQT